MSIRVACSMALAALLAVAAGPVAGQTTPTGQPAPPPAGSRPDLQGIWQALNSAAEDLEAHAARKGVPAGLGVVEGNTIPYLPEALKQRQQNLAQRESADPLAKCLFPGVPRVTYLPFPFQVVQLPDMVVIVYEFLNLTRYIFLDGSPAPSPDVVDFYMGYSRGRYEGNSLVVEVTNFNGETWLDKAGNFHSNDLRVVERFTRVSPDVMSYEVTLEDPKVFARPWKMSMPLYRRQERDLRLLEYECYEFREDELSQAEEDALRGN